jgi:hypothetical protein
MLKLEKSYYSFPISFLVVIIVHLIVLFFFKKDTHHQFTMTLPQKQRLHKIEFISPEDLDRLRKVGIKRANKPQIEQPDFKKNSQPTPQMPQAGSAPNYSPPSSNVQKTQPAQSPQMAKQVKVSNTENKNNEKMISVAESHEVLKHDALKSFSFNRNSVAAQKISNFEIRYERPEGVSEDELNSDEKAFYSFYKRSYASYISNLYATYEQVAVSRPQLHRDFENQHLLVARIDYDENGNIVMVKVLKSSDSDDIAYFFEETLKKLVLPNPPKIFVKKKKQFSIYYQVQIN